MVEILLHGYGRQKFGNDAVRVGENLIGGRLEECRQPNQRHFQDPVEIQSGAEGYSAREKESNGIIG